MKSSQELSKNKHWEFCISTWRVSGKSARQWCKEQNIPQSTFKYWQDRLSEKKLDPKAFIEIPHEEPSNTDSGIEILYQGFQIHVCKEFDQATLFRCLKAVRSSAC